MDLAPLTTAEQLAGTILVTLGLGESMGAKQMYGLLEYLADRQMLVLDNYEHLLTGDGPDRQDGYGLVTRLLKEAPEVKLLVTSRAWPNVAAEWLELAGGAGRSAATAGRRSPAAPLARSDAGSAGAV